MKLTRIFAHAVARRVAYVLVALLFAWMGLGRAEAAVYSDEGAAKTACLAAQVAASVGNRTPTPTSCITRTVTGGFGNYQCYVWNSVNTYACKVPDNNFQWAVANSCSNRPTAITLFMPLTGSTQCHMGCVVSYMQNGDDETSTRSPTGASCGDADFKNNCPVGTFWNGYMRVCQPLAPECPEGQERIDGVCKPSNQCPDGMVAVLGSTPGAIQQGSLYCKKADSECPPGNVTSPQGTCLPGEGQCGAGEARRDNGTCGKDSDGDGKADEDDDDDSNDPNKDSASGGDSCNAPPSCSGNAIACMQVKIQWRIDCNTRKKVNIAGGTCNSVPICTGDGCSAMEYNQLIMQWRTACATEKLSNSEGGGSGGETGIKDHMTALKQAEVDALRGLGTDDGHGNVDPNGIFHEFDNSDFNPNLFGGNSGGQCPIALTIGGKTIVFPTGFWTVAAFIGWLMVACAYLWVAVQLGS